MFYNNYYTAITTAGILLFFCW